MNLTDSTIAKTDIPVLLRNEKRFFTSAVNYVCLDALNRPQEYVNDVQPVEELKFVYSMLSQNREVSAARTETVLKFLASPKIVDVLWNRLSVKYGSTATI